MNKQIEEMAREIYEEITSICRSGKGVNCNLISCESCVAKHLATKGYQKVDKDSVIISKEQYSKLLNNQTTVISIDENLKKEYEYELKQARKETVREILKEFLKEFVVYTCVGDYYTDTEINNKIQELAKQYGVEVDNES